MGSLLARPKLGMFFRFLPLMLVAVAGLWALAGTASAKTINGCVIKNHARCAGKDLAGANLVGASLEYADLAHANLAGADLVRANLAHASLAHAWLTGVRLGGANLSGAVLTGVTSGGISGVPKHLPTDWSLVHGYLLQRLARPVFTVTSGPASLQITFSANAHASAYRAQLCNSHGKSCGPVQVVHSGRVFLGLTGGTTYRVSLTAVGNGTHFSTSPTAYRTAAPFATPLATPTFSLTPEPSSLTINAFSPVPDASGYNYQVCNSSGTNCGATISVTDSGTVITGLTGGTTYIIELTAIGDGTAYANSEIAEQAGAPGATQLAAPSFGLTPGPGSLTIDPFSAVPDAVSYLAQQCDAAGSDCAAAVPVTTSGYTFIGLTGGTTYMIRLTAIGDGVAYANSIPASVTGTAAAATESPCSVVDITADTAPFTGAGALQQAVNAATPGDSLTVSGVCVGDTVIGESLTITGSGTLDGIGVAGSVVTIDQPITGTPSPPTVTVTMAGITITGGSGADGGGIDNSGNVALTDVTITGNNGTLGGGIYNGGATPAVPDGQVTVTDSQIDGNSATTGGGIDNTGQYSQGDQITLNSSQVDDNSATTGGGIATASINYGGTSLTVNNSQIDGNSASADGGGISNSGSYKSGSLVTINDSRVDGNSAGIDGGGVCNISIEYAADAFAVPQVDLDSASTVQENTAGAAAGGIYAPVFQGAGGTTLYSIFDADGTTVYNGPGVNFNTADGVYSAVASSSPVNLDGN